MTSASSLNGSTVGLHHSAARPVPQPIRQVCYEPAAFVVPAAVAAQPLTVEQHVFNVVKDTPPMAFYKDTLEGALVRMQTQVAQLSRAILDERRTRNTRRHSIEEERQARQCTDTNLANLNAVLKACRELFATSDHEWWHGHQDLRKQVDKIEQRGNIQVDMCNGSVTILQPIGFKQRMAGEAPTAEFSEPKIASAVCEDLAEVAQLFKCPVRVEGHTKGGEGRFWQTLAQNRARLVADKLVSLGVDRSLLTMVGFPGHLGIREARVEVRLELPQFGGQPVTSMLRRFAFGAAGTHEYVSTQPQLRTDGESVLHRSSRSLSPCRSISPCRSTSPQLLCTVPSPTLTASSLRGTLGQVSTRSSPRSVSLLPSPVTLQTQ